MKSQTVDIPEPTEPLESPEVVEHSEASEQATAPPATGRKELQQYVAVVSLAIALVAVALAAWSLLRAGPSTPPVTAQQVTDAETRACAASNTVGAAVSLQTHLNLGVDPVATQAVAANARLSMAAGSSYLLASLDPATPQGLATEMRNFADDLQTIVMHTMAGVANDEPAQAARLADAEAASTRISALCA